MANLGPRWASHHVQRGGGLPANSCAPAVPRYAPFWPDKFNITSPMGHGQALESPWPNPFARELLEWLIGTMDPRSVLELKEAGSPSLLIQAFFGALGTDQTGC